MAIALPAPVLCISHTHTCVCVLCPGGIQLYCMYVAWAPKSNGNFKSHDIRPGWTQRLPSNVTHRPSASVCELICYSNLCVIYCYYNENCCYSCSDLRLMRELCSALATGQRAHSSTMTWPGSIVFSVISGRVPLRKRSIWNNSLSYSALDGEWMGSSFLHFPDICIFNFNKKSVLTTP